MKTTKHIIIAEREPKWRNFLTQVLQDAGYAVSAYQDAVSSVAGLRQRPSDLVLIDASLQEPIHRLASDLTGVRFLVFSAAPSVSEAIGAFRRGALDYESKVFDRDLVLRVVQTALEKPLGRSLPRG